MVSDSELKVVVLGLGYIGLPTAAVIARTGARVLGVDVTPSVVETVNSGRVHIEEVDLDGLVSGVVARGSLRASLTMREKAWNTATSSVQGERRSSSSRARPASSSSRPMARGHQAAPALSMASRLPGCSPLGALTVTVALRLLQSLEPVGVGARDLHHDPAPRAVLDLVL